MLKEEIEKDDMKIRGVIVRIKDDVPNSVFFVKKDSGKFAKVCLPEDTRSKVIEYLTERTPVSISGTGHKKGRMPEIVELDDIKESSEIIIDIVDGITLRNPIEAKLSYERYDEEDEFWAVSNDELGINGVDKTVEKAREIFEDSLFDDYTVYRSISDEKLSDKALSLKRRLINLFEA